MLLPPEGIQVPDPNHALAGAFCSTMLADCGAQVIKIEPPVGEDGLQRGALHPFAGQRTKPVTARLLLAIDPALILGILDSVPNMVLKKGATPPFRSPKSGLLKNASLGDGVMMRWNFASGKRFSTAC